MTDRRAEAVSALTRNLGHAFRNAALLEQALTHASVGEGAERDAMLVKDLKAVVAIATDPKRFQRTGQVLIVNELGREYGFTDVDGRQPGTLPQQMGLA